MHVLQRVRRQQTALLREGDEQHAVEQLLRGCDQRAGLQIVGLSQCRDELDAPALVVGIQRARDLAFGLGRFIQQPRGLARQQLIGAEQQHQLVVLRRLLRDGEQVEVLVNAARVADRIESDLEHVGQHHELRVRRVHRVFPDLLHRRLALPGLADIEVGRVRALELDRSNNGITGRPEPAQRHVRGASASARFLGDRVVARTTERRVSQQLDEELANERRANLLLASAPNRAVPNQHGPLAQQLCVRWRNRRGGQAAFDQSAIEQRTMVERNLSHAEILMQARAGLWTTLRRGAPGSTQNPCSSAGD